MAGPTSASTSDERPLARASLVDAAPVALILFDDTGRYLDVNVAACGIIGRPREELIGRRNWELFPDTRDGAWHLAFDRVASSGEPERVESYYPAWNRWYLASMRRMPEGVLCMLEETTERNLFEARLARLNERLHSLIQQAPIPVAVWDGPEHRCALFNPAYHELVGGRVREGATLLELFPELEGHPLIARLGHVFATGGDAITPEERIPLRRPDGSIEDRYFSTSWRAIRDDDGNVTSVIAVGTDVSEEVRAREAIAASRAMAEAANRAKDEFLAMLGHELRNPLAAIRNAVDLMRLGPGEPHARAVDVVERQITLVTRLVEDLLDISRIGRGDIALRRASLDIANLLAEAVEVSLPLVEERGHRLEVRVDPGLRVHGDRERLVQVFSNLLTNAAKYTPPRGSMALEASRHEGDVCIRVRDDGVGIDAALLPRVFETFVQSDRSNPRSRDGLGLGLAIAKKLVEQHGGRITAASEGAGRGSEFTVFLPAVD